MKADIVKKRTDHFLFVPSCKHFGCLLINILKRGVGRPYWSRSEVEKITNVRSCRSRSPLTVIDGQVRRWRSGSPDGSYPLYVPYKKSIHLNVVRGLGNLMCLCFRISNTSRMWGHSRRFGKRKAIPPFMLLLSIGGAQGRFYLLEVTRYFGKGSFSNFKCTLRSWWIVSVPATWAYHCAQ